MGVANHIQGFLTLFLLAAGEKFLLPIAFSNSISHKGPVQRSSVLYLLEDKSEKP